jgi:indolepyruvate decarboxylase
LRREDVRQYVEHSDCVIMLGAFLTDINLGVFTARLDPARCIYATSEKLSIRYHTYEEVRFKDFMRGLVRARLRRRPLTEPSYAQRRGLAPGKGKNGWAGARVSWPADGPPPRTGQKQITVKRLFQRLNAFLTENTVVVADVGDVLFGAADLFIYRRTEFLGPAYYASMGFAVPASIGAQFANPKLRPLVLVGDGAFQMTGLELSTAARYHLNPIVVVLNNGGYGTERHMQDGPYNDLAPWKYHRLPELLGAGRGFLVNTEKQLDEALAAAAEHTRSFCLVEVCLQPLDRSPALQRLAKRRAERN